MLANVVQPIKLTSYSDNLFKLYMLSNLILQHTHEQAIEGYQTVEGKQEHTREE